MYVIVCSRLDIASQNIKDNLLRITDWDEIDLGNDEVIESTWVREDVCIVDVKDDLTNLNGIDRKLSGFHVDSLIFASRHKSDTSGKIFTTHFTGAYGSSLCVPSPHLMRTILLNLMRYAQESEWKVVMEATHHGPTEVDIPLVFVEIGSSPSEWKDSWAGEVVARAILDSIGKEKKCPVGVGLGGPHYLRRETELMSSSNVSFGHCFSSVMLERMDEDVLGEAVEKSKADFIYVDRKSVSPSLRKRIEEIANKFGYTILREKDVRAVGVLGMDDYLKLSSLGKVRIDTGVQGHESHDSLLVVEMPGDLWDYLDRRYRNSLRKLIEEHGLGYIESGNGNILPIIFGFDESVVEKAKDILFNVLSSYEEYEFHSPSEIIVRRRKINMQKAESLGLSGAELRKLLKGEVIEVDGKAIKPEMVYESESIAFNIEVKLIKGELV